MVCILYGTASNKPTYRLLGAALASTETPTAASPRSQKSVAVQAVGAEEAKAVEMVIEEERSALPDDDLLRREAPQE